MNPQDLKTTALVEFTVSTVEEFGRMLRAKRKSQDMTIHDAALLADFSVQFLHDLETGKPTIQMGRALTYARMLGLRVSVSDPSPAPGPENDSTPGLKKTPRPRLS